MNLYTIDFESYYAPDFTLSKMTTEAYIRDPRFETILVGIKQNDEKSFWVDQPKVAKELKALRLEHNAVLAHHAHFDGLILSHHYDIRPRLWFDTLSMARAVHGAKGGNSLAKLAVRHNVGVKGTEVLNALGKRRKDFTAFELAKYGEYCCNDCDLEFALFHQMRSHFTQEELMQVDSIIRMFTEPVLSLRTDILQTYLDEQRLNKATALLKAGCQMSDVSSSAKFADALRFYGVEPPTKISKTTGKTTYAFAKTDEAMHLLAEHDNEDVQALVAARLEAKSTIGETRALRMIEMQGRGPTCVYLNYYGASNTGRVSGGDKMNWQNLRRGSALRLAVEAPEGHSIVVVDSANIESRVLDWLAGQEDAIEAYIRYDRGEGPDIYCVTAEKIFHKHITKSDNPDERQMGKVAKLGLGYGMGWEKFVFAVRAQAGKVIVDEQARQITHGYRQSHPHVTQLWERCQNALSRMVGEKYGQAVDFRGVIKTDPKGLRLPNGMLIRYTDLKYDRENKEFTYFNGRNREYLWGGKVTENIIQALARIIVMDQAMAVASKYRMVLTVHDEAVFCVPEDEAEQCVQDVIAAFKQPLAWCRSLPLNAAGGYHQSYGKAKE
jgi:DNA polymerase